MWIIGIGMNLLYFLKMYKPFALRWNSNSLLQRSIIVLTLVLSNQDLLIKLILYTLKNQQIFWSGKYYILNQGIPTGGKHSVSLANIMLTYVLLCGLPDYEELHNIFSTSIKLWKRFIDDCAGIYKGSINEFVDWFIFLQSGFGNYDLEFTRDTDSNTINANNDIIEKELKMVTFSDVDLFKSDGTIHTNEHRKATSSTPSTYVSSNSETVL